MPQDLIGWTHTIAAMLALLTGSIILYNTKGTPLHKTTGRVYGISMLIVCTTSFMIYRVHNTFGVLHVFAIISTVTLVLGMIPLYIKGFKNPVLNHLAWMYWSVIGLYSAFTAEILTRAPMIFDIPDSYGIFYGLVFLSAGFVGMIGSRYFKKKKKIWEEQFGSLSKLER